METVSLKPIMESRAQMYGLLSRIYIVEINQSFLDEMKRMRFPQNTGNAAIDEAYLSLYSFLRKTRETVLDDLAVDYARAFIGSGTTDARAAYPYESVYTSSTGLTMQEARDEALAIYRSQGLDKNDRWNESEDHLAMELLFMHEMSKRTAEVIDSDEEKAAELLRVQQNFIADHLLNWVPKFAKDVPLYTKLDFYAAATNLTLAYLQEDAALIAELLGDDGADESFADVDVSEEA